MKTKTKTKFLGMCWQCGWDIEPENDGPVKCLNCGKIFCKDCVPGDDDEIICFPCRYEWEDKYPGASPMF